MVDFIRIVHYWINKIEFIMIPRKAKALLSFHNNKSGGFYVLTTQQTCLGGKRNRTSAFPFKEAGWRQG